MHTHLNIPGHTYLFDKKEETSIWILYSSIICLINHSNLWWFIFTWDIQDNKSKYQLDKVANNWLCEKKFITRRENRNSSKPSWKERNNPPKCQTKNRPFIFYTISKDRICHIISSRVESSEQVVFEYDGSPVIVNNSATAHIFSEE